MKKKTRSDLSVAVCLLSAFGLWTAAVKFIDVKAIGPQNSSVGFAALNGFIHRLTGVNMALYTVTDWLSLVPASFGAAFALLGFIQLIKRKSLFKVDRSLLILGGFYAIVCAAYLFFEEVIVNYRPVLINGILEASYPSSTTMLVLCFMPTALMQLNKRINHKAIKLTINFLIVAFTAFLVIGRFLSGVHWATDIVGGAMLSAGLVAAYRSFCGN